jgi:hypothetical protein
MSSQTFMKQNKKGIERMTMLSHCASHIIKENLILSKLYSSALPFAQVTCKIKLKLNFINSLFQCMKILKPSKAWYDVKEEISQQFLSQHWGVRNGMGVRRVGVLKSINNFVIFE